MSNFCVQKGDALSEMQCFNKRRVGNQKHYSSECQRSFFPQVPWQKTKCHHVVKNVDMAYEIHIQILYVLNPEFSFQA